MLKLFQSIFGSVGGDEAAYPEALIEAATERAIDATDARLRLVRGYRGALREPVLCAIDHVIKLVDGLSAPVRADAAGYRADVSLRAMFSSLDRLFEVLGKDPALAEARRQHPDAEHLVGMLSMQLSEKRLFGMDLEEDLLKRDVQQTVLSFDQHRLVDPHPDEVASRRALKRRAFDHLLSQALQEMSQRRSAREELGRERALLRRKLAALRAAGWNFEDPGRGATSGAAAVEAKLGGIERELEKLGPDARALQSQLELLVGALSAPAARLRIENRRVLLDQRNILRTGADSRTRELCMQELHDGRGEHRVLIMLSVHPGLLPQADFFAAAQRYL